MRLAPDRAPAAAVPRRFLFSVPIWGMIAAIILMMADADVLASRWHPVTLALTHACTLGVLGNAMFGSLLQFLPAAAGVRVCGGARVAAFMHAALSAGTLLLVGGLLMTRPGWLMLAAVPLSCAFGLLGFTTLPGLCVAAQQQQLLRSGLGLAILGGCIAATLGVGAALVVSGYLVMPLAWLVDVHAAWGTLGWFLLLLAVVARDVMPMFQGSARLPAWCQLFLVVVLPTVLLVGSFQALKHGNVGTLRLMAATSSAAFAIGGLWLQWRSSSSRNAVLRDYWRAGLLVLLGAACALLAGNDVLAGVLGIGIAAPLLIVGMLLEICAFIAWIELQRCYRRGAHIPPIQRLLPTPHKALVLRSMIFAALVLVLATAHPCRLLSVLAGLAWLLAWAVVAFALCGLQYRAAAVAAECAA